MSQRFLDVFSILLSTYDNEFISFNSTLVVPPLPTVAEGTYFIWPGLQPGTSGANYLPIDNGVLQPVLTFGPTCAPGQTAAQLLNAYGQWSISGQYVNTVGSAPGFTGCNGGAFETVQPGDALRLEIALLANSTTWYQKATVASSGLSVDYAIDLRGQGQGWAEFVVELWGGASAAFDLTVTDIALTVQLAGDPSFCLPSQLGSGSDSVVCSAPQLSTDGKTCLISSCHYYGASGVPAITTTAGTTTVATTAITTATITANIATTTAATATTAATTTTSITSTSKTNSFQIQTNDNIISAATLKFPVRQALAFMSTAGKVATKKTVQKKKHVLLVGIFSAYMNEFAKLPSVFARRAPLSREGPTDNILPAALAERIIGQSDRSDEHEFRRISNLPNDLVYTIDLGAGGIEMIYDYLVVSGKCIGLLVLDPIPGMSYDRLSLVVTLLGISRNVLVSERDKLPSPDPATSVIALPFAIPVRTPRDGLPFSFASKNSSITYSLKFKFYFRDSKGLTVRDMFVPVVVAPPWAAAAPPATPQLSAGDSGLRMVVDSRGRIQGNLSVLREVGSSIVGSGAGVDGSGNGGLGGGAKLEVVLRPKVLSNLGEAGGNAISSSSLYQGGNQLLGNGNGSGVAAEDAATVEFEEGIPEYTLLDELPQLPASYDSNDVENGGISSNVDISSSLLMPQRLDFSSLAALNNIRVETNVSPTSPMSAPTHDLSSLPNSPPLPYSPFDPLSISASPALSLRQTTTTTQAEQTLESPQSQHNLVFEPNQSTEIDRRRQSESENITAATIQSSKQSRQNKFIQKIVRKFPTLRSSSTPARVSFSSQDSQLLPRVSTSAHTNHPTVRSSISSLAEANSFILAKLHIGSNGGINHGSSSSSSSSSSSNNGIAGTGGGGSSSSSISRPSSSLQQDIRIPKYKIVMPRTMMGAASRVPIDFYLKHIPTGHVFKRVECVLTANVRCNTGGYPVVDVVELAHATLAGTKDGSSSSNSSGGDEVGDVGFDETDNDGVLKKRIWLDIPDSEVLGCFGAEFQAPLIVLTHRIQFRMFTEKRRRFGGGIAKGVFNLGSISVVLMR
ncbi:hypothetical protein HK100_000707 [Physocladia obscura]|uniref:Uncharacterized protein n=1 Tax=Physocladia obscura TaxID=109957 RepID=A0AAD5SZI5_9FUNG|nr:hypothetical protein HK100_000707 [Physocladia obscura]